MDWARARASWLYFIAMRAQEATETATSSASTKSSMNEAPRMIST